MHRQATGFPELRGGGAMAEMAGASTVTGCTQQSLRRYASLGNTVCLVPLAPGPSHILLRARETAMTDLIVSALCITCNTEAPLLNGGLLQRLAVITESMTGVRGSVLFLKLTWKIAEGAEDR